jgi:quercetin dioxygenase-like cupin family protein
MIIKNMEEVPVQILQNHGGLKKQVLIGQEDGSREIVMRYFAIDPGVVSPYHSHGFPHLVYIQKGHGALVDHDGREHALGPGMVVYIHDDERHALKNTDKEPFEFLCMVPERGEG